ncbi:uncharacterized protein LOC123898238 [Trifolium pratense]|uniref:uncharacterized protein LOC123898238 n=1 Tax=Trifolium pratense TaxID=57577 RepID=UPI0008451A98|nr:uncharacterized protein LOC123898238 [Trifolium pratense]
MPLTATVCALNSFSTIVTAQSSFPPKRNLPISSSHIFSRRDIALLSLFSLSAAPASAIDFGISGPKDWLKEQKKKSFKFLLAPVDASRESLRSVYLYLTAETGASYTDEDLQKFQELFRSAARDCVPEDRNSFVAFQANTGVEVCTFRLIVKNAASLLGKKDPVKLEAEALLDNLIRSFASISGMASETNIELASDRRKIADAVSDTITCLDKFEQGIRDCLEI